MRLRDYSAFKISILLDYKASVKNYHQEAPYNHVFLKQVLFHDHRQETQPLN